MADSSTEHLVLPVGVTTLVVAIVQTMSLDIATKVVGCRDVQFLSNHVDSQISIVAHVCALALVTTLGGDDDHTIGSLRTVDSRSGSIAEHVDRLNIIGSYH